MTLSPTEAAGELAGAGARDGLRPALERGLAVLGLVAAGVPLALTALAIRLDLGAPVMFRQQRAGRFGEPFAIAKLRTMSDARDAAGVLLPDAARVTPLSRLVRRLRLDELPQLLAVAAGTMGLVGPRPLLPQTVAGFGRLGRVRALVRPGLTGWAQVNGNTALTDADKLALDVWYVDHRCLARDALILALTLRVVILGERVNRRRVGVARRHVANRYGGTALTEAVSQCAAPRAEAA